MNVAVQPGSRSGAVRAPASKSAAHRLLICAALSREPSVVVCDTLSRDILATIGCLNAAGARIDVGDGGRLSVHPVVPVSGRRDFPCGESGSTLRFLLPVAGVLGLDAVFHMEGRLPRRPLSPLDRELTAHGMTLALSGSELRCSGRLAAGGYKLPGNVSSQYISGLLMALPLAEGNSTLTVTEPVESAGYIDMTEEALRLAGARPEKQGNTYRIRGTGRLSMPGETVAEGDWSGAAFFLCMGALSEKGVTVSGLNPASCQGDRGILDVLRAFGADIRESASAVTVRRGELNGTTVDARMVPDLVPAVSALAAAAEGETRIVHAERLRLKESDRLATTAAMIRDLGGEAEVTQDGLRILGKTSLAGGAADPAGDHRIAMAAAVAAAACLGPVTVTDAECVEKSYPGFWDDLQKLEAC